MTPVSEARVTGAFRAVYGESPALVWAAPGRVNLIGEHTDYNGGWVLPFALPQRTCVAVSGADRREWSVWSQWAQEQLVLTPSMLVPGAVSGWAAYVAAVLWCLGEAGVQVPGARIAICSDVPLGAGLSSSAALECALLGALLDLAGNPVQRARWPGLAQRAENGYVGVPCGIMDPTAATWCRAGHALLLDCRSLAMEHVALGLPAAGLGILVVDTRAPHRLVTGEYAARRASCETAARRLGVGCLRDVADLPAALATLADPVLRRRVRHVVTENERVLSTVTALRAGRPHEIGAVLSASHASLRDDYEVSVAELDLAVDAAVDAGALGARMTGGGFGGCVIALVALAAADAVAQAVAAAFAVSGLAPPVTFLTAPAAGLARIG